MKRTAPAEAETVLNKHTDILLRIFGRVNNIDYFDAVYLADWIVEHKRELGRRYKEIQEWGDDVACEVLMQEPTKPLKTYICRYCGKEIHKSDIGSLADNTIICRRCAGYEL